MYSLPSVKAFKFMKQIMTRPFFHVSTINNKQVAFRLSYKLFCIHIIVHCVMAERIQDKISLDKNPPTTEPPLYILHYLSVCVY